MRRTAAVLALVALAALVFTGGRGLSKIVMGDDYTNDIRAETDLTMYRFHSTKSGSTSSADSTKRVYFLDIFNGTGTPILLHVFTPTGFGTPPKVNIRMASGTNRSLDGFPIDSIKVQDGGNIAAGLPIIFTGMDKR